MIPQQVRDKIGVADLTPIWRLTARDGYNVPDMTVNVDITEQLTTTPGPAITARTDLTTAPVRELTITTTDQWPLDVTDPDAYQYRLEAGYRDTTGEEHYETIGAYFLNTQEFRTDGVTTDFASAEVQVIGKKNYDDTAVLYHSAVAALDELPQARFDYFVRRILNAALPQRWEARLPYSATMNWQPETLEDFSNGAGTDIWSVVTSLGTASEQRVAPRRDGTGWTAGPIYRTPSTPVATIPRTHCADYVETRAPRERIDHVYARWQFETTDGDLWDQITVAGHNINTGVYAFPGAVETLHSTSTMPKALAWAESRLAALNTLVRQHTFTTAAMPWIDPGDTITITAPAGDTDLMVSTLNYDVTAGTMTITAREIL